MMEDEVVGCITNSMDTQCPCPSRRREGPGRGQVDGARLPGPSALVPDLQ